MAPTYILEAADLQLPHHHDKPCVSTIHKISCNRNQLCFVQADNRGGLPDEGGHGSGGCGRRAAPPLQAHYPLAARCWLELLRAGPVSQLRLLRNAPILPRRHSSSCDGQIEASKEMFDVQMLQISYTWCLVRNLSLLAGIYDPDFDFIIFDCHVLYE